MRNLYDINLNLLQLVLKIYVLLLLLFLSILSKTCVLTRSFYYFKTNFNF
jgi:hypothetical protein